MKAIAPLVSLACLAALATSTASQAWSLSEDLRIGSVDGPDALTLVASLTVDRQGRIYVLEPENQRVRVFGSDGTALAELGRRGDGPGEFRLPLHMGWVGDTLWVFDVAASRVTLWHQHGRAYDFRIAAPTSDTDPAPGSLVALLGDGSLLLAARPGMARDSRRGGSDGGSEGPLYRTARDGADIVHWTSLRFADPVAIQRTGSRLMLGNQPFDDGTLIGVAPDGNLIGIVHRRAAARSATDHFSMLVLNAAGDTLTARRYPYRPTRLADQAVNAAVRIPDARFGERFPSEEAALDAIREALYIPLYHPPVSRIVVGRDHSIWLRREDAGAGNVTWMVLDPSGNPLGRVETDRNVRIVHADQDRVWAVVHDEWEVPHVVRYRIAR